MNERINDEALREKFKKENYNFLFSFLSFENRCKSIMKYISEECIEKLYLFANQEFLENGEAHKNKTLSKCESNEPHDYCIKLQDNKKMIEQHIKENEISNDEIIVTSLENMEIQQTALLHIAKDINHYFSADSEFSVAIDISCFNRKFLIDLLYTLRKNFSNIDIDVIYYAAKDYGKSPFSIAPYETGTFMSFPGYYDVNKDTKLIIIPGCETKRVESVIEYYTPDIINFCYSNEPDAEGHQTESLKLVNEFLERYNIERGVKVEKFEIEVSDIYVCHSKLKEIVNRSIDSYNIVLCSFYAKPSVVATYLIAEEYPQIAMCYSVAKEYDCKNYSNDISKAYLCKLLKL